MNTFIRRLFRSGMGTRVAIRFIRKHTDAFFLKQKLRHIPVGTFPFSSSRELNLFMDGRAYLDNAEIPLLARYAASAKHCIVEIGSAFGASSSVFLLGSRPDTDVHSIDPFIVDSMAPFQATKERCTRNVASILGAAGRPEEIQKWHLHPDYSYNIAPMWKEPIDLLFIDGDHTYDAVRKDFEDWLPLVTSGGCILFHDSRREPGAPDTVFNRGWPGPTKLAEELRVHPGVTLVEEAFSITAWRKL